MTRIYTDTNQPINQPTKKQTNQSIEQFYRWIHRLLTALSLSLSLSSYLPLSVSCFLQNHASIIAPSSPSKLLQRPLSGRSEGEEGDGEGGKDWIPLTSIHLSIY